MSTQSPEEEGRTAALTAPLLGVTGQPLHVTVRMDLLGFTLGSGFGGSAGPLERPPHFPQKE